MKSHFLYKNESDPQTTSPAASHDKEFPVRGDDQERPDDDLSGLQQGVLLAQSLPDSGINPGASMG